MTNFLKRFAQDESGAVTVDWVVLTAAVVGLGIAIGGVIFQTVGNIAGEINTEIGDHTVATELPEAEG